jgi:hypothetical protein
VRTIEQEVEALLGLYQQLALAAVGPADYSTSPVS